MDNPEFIAATDRKPAEIRLGRGVGVLLGGLFVSALPLLWPLFETDFDPNYGKFPLWVLAGVGSAVLSLLYSFIVLCSLRKIGSVWIPLIGLACLGMSLLADFAFWGIALLVIPLGPLALIAVSVLATFPEKEER